MNWKFLKGDHFLLRVAFLAAGFLKTSSSPFGWKSSSSEKINRYLILLHLTVFSTQILRRGVFKQGRLLPSADYFPVLKAAQSTRCLHYFNCRLFRKRMRQTKAFLSLVFFLEITNRNRVSAFEVVNMARRVLPKNRCSLWCYYRNAINKSKNAEIEFGFAVYSSGHFLERRQHCVTSSKVT